MQSSPFNGALPLPEVPLPSDTVCYTVELPNEPRILEAFEGAIQMLSRWPYWARDDDHRGVVAANVFKDLYQTLEAGACEVVNIRLNPVNFCVLQLTTDGGLHWTDVADLSNCAHAAATDEITQRLDDGRLAPAGQQPPAPYQPSGHCTSYYVTIQGNDRWHAPIPVQANDTVSITNAKGGWWSGDILDTWDCPSGEQYLLGDCNPGTGATDPSDPAPTVDHMRLIANWNSTFVDAYNQIVSIPGGVSLTEIYLQANDSSLSDNQGSITCRVEICSAGCAVPSSGIAGCIVTDNMDGTFTMAVAASNAADGDFQATIVIPSVYDTPPGVDCHAVFNIDSIVGFSQPHMSHFPGGWGSGSGCTVDNHLTNGDDPNTLNGVVFCAFLYIRSGTAVSVTFHF